jgi:enoyl-CoA hydratase
VNQVVAPADLLPSARALAEKILTKPALAICQAKASLRAAATNEEDAGLRFEQEAFGIAFSSPDRIEGTKAFLEKRPPKWSR